MHEIRRTYRFCASHCVRDPTWTEAENARVYGAAARQPGHGHNYRLTLVIEGAPDPKTRRVVDLAALDAMVDEEVIRRFDHRNLNADVPSLTGQVPTLEVLLVDVWRRVADRLPSGRLREVVLQVDELLEGSFRPSS